MARSNLVTRLCVASVRAGSVCFVLAVTYVPGWGQLIVAHRGASHDAPENTLAAFQLAWEQGADGIEGDFHLTSDRRIVCIHDRDTERVAGAKQIVADTPLSALRRLDVGAWKNERWRGENIPTLQEVLRIVPNDKMIFIELKTGPDIVTPLASELASCGLRADQIVIISFHEETLAACHDQLPHLKSHWLTGYEQSEDGNWLPGHKDVIAAIRRTHAMGFGSQAETAQFNARFLRRLADAGVTEFHVWTVDDAAVARLYQGLGAWSITTNRPGWLREQIMLGDP